MTVMAILLTFACGCRTTNQQCQRETALLRAEILDLEDQLYAFKATSRPSNSRVVMTGGELPVDACYDPGFDDVIYESDMVQGDIYFGDQFIDDGYYEGPIYDDQPCADQISDGQVDGGPVYSDDPGIFGDVQANLFPLDAHPSDSYPIESSSPLIEPHGQTTPTPAGQIVPGANDPFMEEIPRGSSVEPTPAPPASGGGANDGSGFGATIDRFRTGRRSNSPDVHDVFIDPGNYSIPANEPGYRNPAAREYRHGQDLEATYFPRSQPETFLPSFAPLESPDAAVTEIYIVPESTYGQDVDGNPGDEGLVLLVQPRAADQEILKAAGAMTISVIDPAANTLVQRVGLWRFQASEMRLFETGIGSSEKGYLFRLPWDGNLPKNGRLVLFVRYLTSDGRRLESSSELLIDPPADNYSPDDPDIQEWSQSDSRWDDDTNDDESPSDLVARRRGGPDGNPSQSNTPKPEWRPVR